MLDDPALIEAWEKGEDKRYIPLKFRSGKPSADSAASAERMGLLYRHIRRTLASMSAELRGGAIEANPCQIGAGRLSCETCDFFDACHFADGEGGETARSLPKLKNEQVWALLEGGEEA